ncbi:hypothetical protein [Sporichthya polymorpha]|uniref:hypothetical protein n=1 Tax=Sporichthya polymorpha TaxID=35751 RepID=UPI000363A2E2|nr:hypothetical protein [Sporichthya polymorpha]
MTRTRGLRRSAAAVLTAAALTLSAAPAGAASDPKAAASQALGRGDGAAAAAAIREANVAADPATLAEIIYDGGVIAVDAGKGDAFADAVPVAFVDGGVSFVNANEAFRHAFGIVAANGVTPEQGRVGGTAIVKTEAAYASTGNVGP